MRTHIICPGFRNWIKKSWPGLKWDSAKLLNPDAVRSSVGRRLGLPDAGLKEIRDQKAEGLVEILLDATVNYSKKMTPERIWGWHAALFPTGYSGMVKISVGQWRDDFKGPMQVISGPIGKEKVHFEAPPAKKLDKEMQAFISWINAKNQLDGIIRAGLAHIWFVTIHPFGDGNGRIARTLTDMLLARDENNPKRFYSLSSQIMTERSEYYEILKATQSGTGDITQWLEWFLECMNRAILNSNTLFKKAMTKARFWQEFAQRELADLVNKGILIKMPGGGRSASYDFEWEKWFSFKENKD